MDEPVSKNKSLEAWIWDAACSIRGAKDAAKYKDYILPLIFTKRLGLDDVEAEIIGKSYEYLIRKFAEGSGHSAGEFYTPGEVGEIMARVLVPDPGMEIYDPTCGSGNAGTNKEKDARKWFVDQDLIENVLYLPENLFYNTTAPGIVIFLNKDKPDSRQGKVFLVNASQVFEKGDPKNFIPREGIDRIVETLTAWKEEEKFSRIVGHDELKKNDYNISPSRYIHTGDAETYRPLAEIVGELEFIEAEAKETDKLLKEILNKIGV